MGVHVLAPAQCLTVVNGACLRRNARDKYISTLFATQISTADFLALNRLNEANRRFLQQTFKCPKTISSIADLLHAGTNAQAHDSLPSVPLANESHFRTETISVPNPVQLGNLEAWLQGLPAGVERLKGIVWIDTDAGSVEMRFLSYTQGLYAITPVGPKLSIAPGTIVAVLRSDLGGRIGVPG